MILRRSSTSSEQGQYDDDDVSGQFSRDGERREDGDLGGGGLIETKSGGCYLFNTANTSAIYC